MHKTEKFIVSLITPLLIGTIGAGFTLEAIPTWYTTLNKPFFTPPNWLFGPVWTVLYILMGIACLAIWNSKDSLHKKCALHLYGIQLALNALWTPIFFGAHNLWLSLLIILLLWIFILFTIVTFYRIKPWTIFLLIPYLAWVTFASALNAWILWLN